MKDQQGKDRPPRRIKLKEGHFCRKQEEAIPEEELRRYPLLMSEASNDAEEMISWLTNRWSISHRVIDQFGIRLKIDEATAEPMLVFVTRDFSERAVYAHYMPSQETLVLRPIRPCDSSFHFAQDRAHWFGEHLAKSSHSAVITTHPIDVLRLASLGIRGAIASCGPPTTAQLLSIRASSIYAGFGTTASERDATVFCLSNMKHKKRFSLPWEEVGATHARDILSLSQFKKYLRRKQNG